MAWQIVLTLALIGVSKMFGYFGLLAAALGILHTVDIILKWVFSG